MKDILLGEWRSLRRKNNMDNMENHPCSRCGKQMSVESGSPECYPQNYCCCQDCEIIIACDCAADRLGITINQFVSYLYNISK